MFPYCFAIIVRPFRTSFYNEEFNFTRNEILLLKRNDIQYIMDACEECVRFIDIPCHIISDYLYIRLRDADALCITDRKNSFFRKKAYGIFLNSLMSLVEQQKNINLYESALFVLLDYLNDQKQLLPVCKRTARAVLTGMCYSTGSAMRHGSSSLTRLTGQSAMTPSTWRR